MVSLPPDFVKQMKQLLQTEFTDFMDTYTQSPTRGLRINKQKILPDRLISQVPFELEPIPWCEEGYYFDYPKDRPGKHVYHAAGLYYIQDASAMAPALALDPQPGEKILDLCAAPGGKSTQIAAKMNGQGLLVSNEIDGKRIRVLIENLERLGITHSVVANETPERLAKHFPQFFDRILVDAPCSGEGMFRKDRDTRNRWSARLVDQCAQLQGRILDAAATMLRPGGRLVYSTCTFNQRENEGVIETFLATHPSFQLVPTPQQQHYKVGYGGIGSRLWPHHLRGEGHFIAVLEKDTGDPARNLRLVKHKPLPKTVRQLLQDFWKETLSTPVPLDQTFTMYGDHLYLISDQLPSLKGVKVKRPGFYLGEIKKNRFVPSYALAMAQSAETMKRVINFSSQDPDLYRYLQGETLPCSETKGWTIVAVDSFPLSWGKVAGGMLKNHLPKWLRWDKQMLPKK